MGGDTVSDLDLLLKKVNFVLLLQELLLLSCNLWRNCTEVRYVPSFLELLHSKLPPCLVLSAALLS